MPEVELPLNAPVFASAANENFTDATILVIDDEAGIRESLEVLLSLEGYAVKMAVDGEEGLRMLDQDSFDLVLLDLALPGQSGLELLPQIKERQPQLPVIMITPTAPSTTSLKLSEPEPKTSSRSPGTTKSSSPTSVPPSPVTRLKKKTSS